ncbi:MAG: hypothetical protein ACM3RX_03485 [Methanococcaceae archaeon]
MAILEKPALGMVYGKVGELVFRRVDNTIVITTYPDHIKISDSAESKSNRKNFGVLSRIVKAVNSVTVFKLLWAKYPGKTISTKLKSVNKNRLGENGNISGIILAPAETYFPVQLAGFNINGNIISIVIEGLEKTATLNDRQYLSAQGIIQVYDNEENKQHFIGIASKDEINKNGEPVTFEFMIDSINRVLLESSTDIKFLVNIIYKNYNLEPTYISENIYICPAD